MSTPEHEASGDASPETDEVRASRAVTVKETAFRIGRYEIRGEIGRGAMGIVYEAHDPSLRRTIALKTFHLSFAVSPPQYKAFEERFFAEARIAARLSHPGIVAVHDVGSDPQIGTLYIALEYVQGRTLQEVIKEGVPLGWREALRITCRIAEALQYAHAKHVVHRDIKPANIMLLPSGEPKVLDFGIARIQTSPKRTTSEVFGTPLFMAPEQALGQKPDGRADLFSLGSIAYTLLTGHLAFQAPNIPATVRRLLQDHPLAPSQLVPGLPSGVDEVIARALAKSPEERYASGQEMVEDIQALLGEGPAGAIEAAVAASATGSGPWAFDMDAELAALVENSRPLPKGVPNDSSEQSAVTLASVGHTSSFADRVPGLRPYGKLRRLRFLPAGLGALSVLGLALHQPPPSSEGPTESAPTASGSPRHETAGPVRPQGPAGAALRTLAAADPRNQPPSLPPSMLVHDLALAEPARLKIAFEHPLQGGTLRLWIDDAMVLEQELESRETTGIPGLRFRKGRFDRDLAVEPGEHTVRVQVHWDDNDRQRSLSAAFPSGASRLLEVNLGRLRKNLSLDWK